MLGQRKKHFSENRNIYILKENNIIAYNIQQTKTIINFFRLE